MARDAAVALFAIPGKEADIAAYYAHGGIFVANLATAAVNLFGPGEHKARLAPV